MGALFESGLIVHLILALMAVEAVIICIFALSRRDRLPVAGLLLNLAAGACLLLALGAVLEGAAWQVTGAWLALALLAHVADVVQRLRR
ncbi:MAG: hypothetical protein GVY32_07020 [Gammaproteobacteria bacterium]|jgi:hypothetical protein|nr:hypothetical protein [Gammaproteobacteria bacterium]